MSDLYKRWLREFSTFSDGKERRMGIEIEYSNLSLDKAASLIQQLYGGEIEEQGRYKKRVAGSKYGDFALELDTALLKLIDNGTVLDQLDGLIHGMKDKVEHVIDNAAEKVIPYEIALPPIAFHELEQLNALVYGLRKAGALGTTHAEQYAFWVHLNIEPPDLEPSTILAYLRAFIILQAWLEDQIELDLMRQVTPFINDFSKTYLKLLLQPDYQPTKEEFIDDYLQHNATRNRALDMLPLLAVWDEPRIRKQLPDEKINPRPAFHYRLPNSKVDLLRWSLQQEITLWIPVELLANNSEKLDAMGKEYVKHLNELLPDSNQWKAYLHQCVLELL